MVVVGLGSGRRASGQGKGKVKVDHGRATLGDNDLASTGWVKPACTWSASREVAPVDNSLVGHRSWPSGVGLDRERRSVREEVVSIDHAGMEKLERHSRPLVDVVDVAS